jgi:pimeloyl-ACP methyl ester carboxylesterase
MKLLRRILWTVLAVLTAVILLLTVARVAAIWREAQIEVPAPRDGRFVTIPDGRIFVQMRGPENGTPVILIHGSAAWSGFWEKTADALAAASFRAIAIDLPPFGFSSRPPDSSYSREAQARRIRDVIRALELKNTIVVGHSFGAGSVIETAMRHANALSAMVIICGALGLHEDGKDYPADGALISFAIHNAQISEALTAAIVTNPMFTRSLLSMMLYKKEAATGEQATILQYPQARRGSTIAYAEWLPSLLFPDRTAQSAYTKNYAAISMPTAIIWGDKDSVTPLPQGERLHKLIAHSSFDVIGNVGHIPHIEDPARLLEVLIRRLKELEQRRLPATGTLAPQN